MIPIHPFWMAIDLHQSPQTVLVRALRCRKILPTLMKTSIPLRPIPRVQISPSMGPLRSPEVMNPSSNPQLYPSDIPTYLKPVRFEFEVCHIPRISLYGLHLKRIGGDIWRYKQLCDDLVGQMHL
eukprot:Sdes_comp8831_c0_seq1m217